MQTIRMIAKNLAKSADGDVPAGEQMAYASYITGMAYSNVGLGLVHGMAHPLGGRLGVAHGVANGILLAPVMEYNKDFTGEKYRDIADASVSKMPTPAISRRFAKKPSRPCANSPST